MGCVAQGTVQVMRKAGSKATYVLINPISEYRVRHKTKEYIVLAGSLIGEKLETHAFALEKLYRVDDDTLSEALREAAFQGMKIEVEIEVKGTEAKVVGLQIPATLPPL